MYFQKRTQYHGGIYVDAVGDGNLFSGIFVFLIVRIKRNVPVVVRAVPENKVKGDWISDELIEYLKDLLSCGFKIRGII